MNAIAKAREEAMAKLMEASKSGPIGDTPESVNALANALWYVGRDDSQTDKDRLLSLCFLTGMATAVLSDVAKRMKEEQMDLPLLIEDYAEALVGIETASERGGAKDQENADAELAEAKRKLNNKLRQMGEREL